MSDAKNQAAGIRLRIFNILHLLSGNSVALLLGLGSVALTARALGPADYGVVALLISFTQAIERLVSFQSWQPLIRYGAHLPGPENAYDLMRLLKFGLMLDMAGALAGWLLAIVAALASTMIFGWSETVLHLVLAYSTVLLFGLTGMATAVLRLDGRFRLVAYGQVGSSAVRLLACGLAFANGGGLTIFVLVWMGTQILASLTTLAIAFRILRKNGMRGMLRVPLRGIGDRFEGIWRFTWSANISLTLWSSAQQLDTLIVGALAGPADAGLYFLAKRVGRVAQQMGGQVQAVIYPDIARLWNQGDADGMWRVVRQTEWVLTGAGIAGVLGAVLLAEPLLHLAVGRSYLAAAPLLILQMIAVALTLNGSVMRSAMLAMQRQNQVLRIVIVATAAFHMTALALVPMIGAIGASIAHVVFGVIWLTGLAIALRDKGAIPSAPSRAAPMG